MSVGPDVQVWSLEDRRKYGTARPWRARWQVGKRPHSRAFPTRAAADAFRSRLIIAVGEGERFDVSTGLPRSWAVTELTVAEWAGQWFASQTPTWAPRSRSNAADTLVRALPLLVPDKATAPPDDLRGDIRAWLSGSGEMPTWLERWSLPMAELTKPLCRAAQAQLSVRDDGRQAAASSINRVRVLMRSLFAAAVEDELIPTQPWPQAPRTRAATRVTTQVDVTTLPDPTQAVALINALANSQPASAGYRVLASLVYFAGMRPGEALALTVDACTLPKSGWGSVTVRQAKRSSTKRWTAADEHLGDPKMGRRRTVPIPPVLVGILRDFIGERRTGLVVPTRSGKPVSLSNLDRAWRKAEPSGTWVIYDLRHACATLWLRAGVPIGTVAERLGHSPQVLLSTYTGVLSGDDKLANERINDALDDIPPDAL